MYTKSVVMVSLMNVKFLECHVASRFEIILDFLITVTMLFLGRIVERHINFGLIGSYTLCQRLYALLEMLKST